MALSDADVQKQVRFGMSVIHPMIPFVHCLILILSLTWVGIVISCRFIDVNTEASLFPFI